jgi:ribonuclease HI
MGRWYKVFMKIYFDGGCQPNPGKMESAVVARGQIYHCPDLGHGSNDQAEWLALLHAMDVALMLGLTDVTLLGDSVLIIRQATGKNTKPSALIRPYHAAFAERAAAFTRLRIRQIGRAQNLAGIALEKVIHGVAGKQSVIVQPAPKL